MGWRKNRKMLDAGLADLSYLPAGRTAWDHTLACLAFGARMDVARGPADLNAWAARHGVSASGRVAELGPNGLVLWHGTSRPRAEKIVQHGLFHKQGVWAAVHPAIPHGFCRSRSDRFAAEGAVVCLVLDRRGLVEGRDFEIEPNENVYRFTHHLPGDVVEYLLTAEAVQFVGPTRAARPQPWPNAQFKKHEGLWVPVQKPPVRYSESAGYATAEQFARLVLDRLLEELGEVAALEFFSAVYCASRPADALTHSQLLDILADRCVPGRRLKWQTFRAAPDQAGPGA